MANQAQERDSNIRNVRPFEYYVVTKKGTSCPFFFAQILSLLGYSFLKLREKNG
jgi:hypothetical protein